MKVIHFTEGAGDPLWGRALSGVGFVPLLEGEGITHVGCMHLSTDAVLDEPALEQPCALLIVYGNATLLAPCRIELLAGTGIVLDAH